MEKFRYNSAEERMKKLNRFLMRAAFIVYGVLIFYHAMLLGENANMKSMVWNIPVLVVIGLVNLIVFKANQTARYYRVIIIVEIAWQFLFYMLTTDATFLGLLLIGVLAITIPYYDKKSYWITFGAYMLLFLVGQLLRQSFHVAERTTTGICQVIMTVAMMLVMALLYNVCKAFSDDALGAVEEQKEEQEKMMNAILDISHTVKENTDIGTEMVDRLWESSTKTAENMNSITEAIEEAANNIEAQSGMTQNIQDALKEAKERSGQIVTVAQDSEQNAKDNQLMMERLKQQAEKIAEANEQVNTAMQKLQMQTAEVVKITEMIVGISNQTNLLALNASIESARAGEAGKGFAVVADQIRQLAEETKNSTAGITQIINELDANAKEVMESVQLSAEAAQSQNEAIVIAADAAGTQERNMQQLLEDIQEIDVKIEHLSESNNRIVDSITGLMATTEEVTASVEQTNENSKQNLSYVENTKDAIHGIQDSAKGLEIYF